MNAHVYEATLRDCVHLADCLRPADRRELEIQEQDPEKALAKGFALGPAWSVYLFGDPIAMFGAVPLTGDIASVWMLASEDLTGMVKKQFVRESKRYLQLLHSVRPTLTNHVWAGNEAHVKWLKWLDFQFETDRIFINKEPFLRFWRRCYV